MLEKYIKAARRENKADLVLKNATYLDVFTATLRKGDIAVVGEKIVGVGEYDGKTEIDCSSLVVLPGYIDGHVHIESSQLSPEEFASLIVPRGTTSIIADPHEITNVCGMAGCEYIAKAAGNVPLDVFLQLPSCVPATPFETSGAVLSGDDIAANIDNDYIFGLGEFMNYPAVIGADEEALQKIGAAVLQGKMIDGHAPALSGNALNAYATAGIKTDHECVNSDDCREKLKRGLYVQLRNGSSAHNIEENTKAMNAYNYRRFILCSDDRNAYDLRTHGEIDDALSRLVRMGVPAPWAIACATLNTAECYGLKDKGAIAPSYDADIAIVENLKEFRVLAVFKRGVLVAEGDKALFSAERYSSKDVMGTVKIKEVRADDFKFDLSGNVRVVRVKPNGILTEEEIVSVTGKDGDVILPKGVCKLAVIERHFASGNTGKCLLKGYGLCGGALGISVAHDSHNLVIAGDDNEAMARVATLLKEAGGGMAIVNGKFERAFALDIAGLMSGKSYEEVIRETEEITAHARKMGIEDGIEPFMSLVFLSLAVIPELRLTDKGLVDVNQFKIVSVKCEE